ncbi:MAG: sensor histidine kinase [Bacteroidales bacterium]|nr:sensor histidine kinase [Bacteroidales bacterium]
MKRKNINKFFVRLLFIFFINFIVKIGDQSINVFSDITLRGIVYTSYFIIYWLCIWYVAEFLNSKIQKRQESSSGSKKFHTFLLFSFHFAYGMLVSFLANLFFRFGDIHVFHMDIPWSGVPLFNPEFTLSLLMIYIMVFSFDIYYQSNIKRKENQIQLEKLKQENTLAQYLNLKSQIEPHFLFNSLSVLSSIIHTDINLAEEFILRLSKTLRYVIEKNELALVPFKEEIRFVEDYFFLIKNRFDEGIIFENSIDKSIILKSYIPPASLQLLIENAIKHNKFTSDDPLRIQLFADGELIVVKNNINLRDDIVDSTNQGIQNLTQRFSYFSDKPVSITINETDFTVAIPILTKTDYERFNI